MRRGFVLALLLAVLVGGCSWPGRPAVVLDREITAPPRLWKMQMYRWGAPVFSGLLATRREGAGAISYVLLDGTGITLLQARVRTGGEQEVFRVLPLLRSKRLPEFLAMALNDIFLLEPDGEPCGRNWLVWLCREAEDEAQVKKAGAGPLTFWSSHFTQDRDKTRQEISFSMPWLGVRMVLRDAAATP